MAKKKYPECNWGRRKVYVNEWGVTIFIALNTNNRSDGGMNIQLSFPLAYKNIMMEKLKTGDDIEITNAFLACYKSQADIITNTSTGKTKVLYMPKLIIQSFSYKGVNYPCEDKNEDEDEDEIDNIIPEHYSSSR